MFGKTGLEMRPVLHFINPKVVGGGRKKRIK